MSNFKGWLTGGISVKPSLAGLSSIEGSLVGAATAVGSLVGSPKINETEVLDVFDYFKTEDNINFLVTEAGEHLGF